MLIHEYPCPSIYMLLCNCKLNIFILFKEIFCSIVPLLMVMQVGIYNKGQVLGVTYIAYPCLSIHLCKCKYMSLFVVSTSSYNAHRLCVRAQVNGQIYP